MSSQPSNARCNPRENHFFEPGVGRKTGVTIAERPRDSEHGMEEMDDLFSPDKPQERTVRATRNRDTSDISRNLEESLSSQDMEVANSTIPEPQQLLTARKNGRLPIPRTNSPIKTYLASPARRGTSLGPVSSPVRGDVVTPRAASVSSRVNRKLFPSSDSLPDSSITSPQKRENKATSKPASASFTNGVRLSPGNRLQPAFETEELTMNGTARAPSQSQSPSGLDVQPDSHQFTHLEEETAHIPNDYESIIEATEIEEIDAVEPIDEPAPESSVVEEAQDKNELAKEPSSITKVRKAINRVVTKKRASQSASQTTNDAGVVDDQPAQKPRRGRPKKVVADPDPANAELSESEIMADVSEEPEAFSGRRPRRVSKESGLLSTQRTDAASQQPSGIKAARPKRNSGAGDLESAPTKRQKTTARKSSEELAPAKKNRTTKVRSKAQSPILERGPPRPKGHGLYTTRREDAHDGVRQTRAGRNVFRPVQYWLGEAVEHGSQFESIENGKDSVFFPLVTGVIRKDEAPIEKRSHSYGKRATKSSKRNREESPEEEEEDLTEPWETEPGRIYGEIRTWNPEDPIGINADERDEEIALSAAAIVTRDIPNSTFKFAKTLTLPFFGSGMVDLPAGALKKPKNSRKMQMVFFVHQGRVSVTVNENTFRIGQGGMWQVPRGNFYSIENDYDKPARIFFSQGCEIEEQLGGDESQYQ